MLKRFFDVIVSFVLIIILFPFLIVFALFVKLDSKGSFIYRQCRVGLNNKDFSIYKFRTMFVNAENKGLITVGDNDPRITRAGKFLRKYKLDELPQLFNVLMGDMSLVGPRPEVRKYVNLYTNEQLKVLSLKPGITDYASIQYADENNLLSHSSDPEATYINEVIPAKLTLNLKYITERNFFVDVKILAMTVVRILGMKKSS